LVNKNHAN